MQLVHRLMTGALLAVCTMAPARAEGVVAALDPCTVVPTLHYCAMDPEDLTSDMALQLIDAEFEHIKVREEQRKETEYEPSFAGAYVSATHFATRSLAAAELSADNPLYQRLRDRAIKTASTVPYWDGALYVAARDINRIQHRAGDMEGALETIRFRVDLIRQCEEDNWTWTVGHSPKYISPEEAWFETADDAAYFGDYGLALEILEEGHTAIKPDLFRSNRELARVHLEGEQFSYAEFAARLAIKAAPYEFDHWRSVVGDPEIDSHLVLIQSRLAQAKEVNDDVLRLKKTIMHYNDSLAVHAIAFLYVGRELARSIPDAGRDFIDQGRLINAIARADENDPDTSEVWACRAIKDDACLIEIAEKSESALVGSKWEWELESVASVYADAGDFISTRRIIDALDSRDCFGFVNFRAISRALGDRNFKEAERWLKIWIECQSNLEPNFNTGYGDGGNLWADIAYKYGRLADHLAENEQPELALKAARAALGLAIEADKTWNQKWLWFRADDLGTAYGTALGALLTAEKALTP